MHEHNRPEYQFLDFAPASRTPGPADHQKNELRRPFLAFLRRLRDLVTRRVPADWEELPLPEWLLVWGSIIGGSVLLLATLAVALW
jgi:hypothetical protein